VYSLVFLTPGLGGLAAGGIQESARIAWQGLRRRAVDLGRPAALLSFGPVHDETELAPGDCIAAAESRAGLVLHALRRRWDAESLLIWHVGLVKLLPILRGRWNQMVVFLHGIEAWRPLPRRLHRLLGRVDLFVSNSEFTWRRFVDYNPAFANWSHHVVPLGWGEPLVDTPLPEDPPAALMLGRMSRTEDYKGHRELIAAWPRVLERLPEARLWIAGDGDLRRELERAASLFGDRVRFWGRVSEETKEDLLRRCRCLALPSRGEGFGLVYLEAMRMGRPCLVSTCDAGREVVNPPEAGLETDPHDVADLTSTVLRLLTMSAEWHRMSTGGRDRYHRNYTASHARQRFAESPILPVSRSCGHQLTCP
jgi:phosphatidylinositol alpha-1,6-mannosyltransferase